MDDRTEIEKDGVKLNLTKTNKGYHLVEIDDCLQEWHIKVAALWI